MSSDDIVDRLRAEVVPCPGKGWDGNGVQHCAECCFGTGVHAATADELRVMVLARDAADTIKNLTVERDASRLVISDAADEIERLRAALALAIGELSTYGPMRYTSPDQLLEHFMQEARRG